MIVKDGEVLSSLLDEGIFYIMDSEKGDTI
jgi:hypothetical protein